MLVGAFVATPGIARAQSPKAATYITDEEIKKVNSLPGVDANGRRSAADSDVTRILNGPSCSGIIAGPDVVSKQVKTGDVIIIPAGVPHGWSQIPDHVDYLSVRPDPDRVLPRDYVNPAIRK
jgi:hypothetical protein